MENFFAASLGFVVTFRVCVVMRTEFRDNAENSGRNFLYASRELCEVTLIWKLFIVIAKQGFLSGGS